jgi:protein arginine N-methyltransferase 1
VNRQITQGARFAFRELKRLLKANKTVRSLLYDLSNSESFTDLFLHERMIADTIRVDAYRKAIARHVQPGDTVIDLGTGTGILSLFASDQRPRRIYAIDHSELIDIARRLAEHNNRASNITFIRVNSREFTPDEKIDVIIHEQISNALFGENMIENLMDLKRRVLKPTGIIMPAKFELYLEPVCIKPSYQIPFIWEQRIAGLDFGFLRQEKDTDKYKTKGYTCSPTPPEAVEFFLCQPQPLLAFDMNTWSDGSQLPTSIKMSRKVERAGQMHGMFLYFRVIFDEEIGFDTSPFSPKTCWRNYLLRTETRSFSESAQISYSVEMSDITDVHKWGLSLE